MKLIKIIKKTNQCVILDNKNNAKTYNIYDIVDCGNKDEELKLLSVKDIDKLVSHVLTKYTKIEDLIELFEDNGMVDIKRLRNSHNKDIKGIVGVDAESADDYNFGNNAQVKHGMYNYIENSAFQGIKATEIFYKKLVDKFL